MFFSIRVKTLMFFGVGCFTGDKTLMFFSIRVKTLMFFWGRVFHWRQTPEDAREILRKSKETQEKGRGKLEEHWKKPREKLKAK